MAGVSLRHWDESLPLRLLAGELARAPNGFSFLAGALFRRLLVGATSLHLPKDAFTLHLFLQHTKRLIDIVVANQNLQEISDRKESHGLRGAWRATTRASLNPTRSQSSENPDLREDLRAGKDNAFDHRSPVLLS